MVKRKTVVALLSLAVMVLFAIDAEKYMKVFLGGVAVWAESVLPAIFPYLLFSKIVLSSNGLKGFFGKKSILARLFNAPPDCGYIAFLSALCGYPVGAKLISERHLAGASKTQCLKLATFCSTAGPIFLTATVGLKFLRDGACCTLLIFCHFAANFLNGLLYRNAFAEDNSMPCPQKETIGGDAMTDSVLSILSIGGYIAVCSTICEMIKSLLPRWFTNEGRLLTAFLLGTIEMTNGCAGVCAETSGLTATVLCCALVSFGGICVLLQNMSYYKKCGIKTSAILAFKATHCAFATILCFVLGKIFI